MRHARVRAHTHTHMRMRMRAHMQLRMHASARTHTHTRAHAHAALGAIREPRRVAQGHAAVRPSPPCTTMYVSHAQPRTHATTHAHTQPHTHTPAASAQEQHAKRPVKQAKRARAVRACRQGPPQPHASHSHAACVKHVRIRPRACVRRCACHSNAACAKRCAHLQQQHGMCKACAHPAARRAPGQTSGQVHRSRV
jgi:hypothetical protein